MLILFFRQMKISLQLVKGFKIHRGLKKEKNISFNRYLSLKEVYLCIISYLENSDYKQLPFKLLL